MNKNISPNSLEALKLVNLGNRQKEVYDIIKATGTITSKGIAFQMGVEINHVTGRVNELMRKQLIRIKKIGKDKANSRVNVNYYCVRKDSERLNVFYESLEDWLKREHESIYFEYEALILHKL